MTTDAQGQPRDAVHDQIDKRLRALQWMVGLGVGWLTAVIAVEVGILLHYR
jgi:hypothetical protein